MDDLGYIGQIALGGTLRLALQCRSSSVPTAPDGAPSWAMYGTSDTSLLTGSLGGSDADSKTGFRTGDAAITSGNGFSSGMRVIVRFAYAVSSSARAAVGYFVVV
jgi:hypothetical protein